MLDIKEDDFDSKLITYDMFVKAMILACCDNDVKEINALNFKKLMDHLGVIEKELPGQKIADFKYAI